jgi:hypothetical protein
MLTRGTWIFVFICLAGLAGFLALWPRGSIVHPDTQDLTGPQTCRAADVAPPAAVAKLASNSPQPSAPPRAGDPAGATPAEPMATRPRRGGQAACTSPAQPRRQKIVDSDLQCVRSQMELYRLQHGDRYPGTKAKGPFDGELFVAQMTHRTDSQGNMGSASDRGKCPYGPYLDGMPQNVFMDGPAAKKVAGGLAPVPRDGSSGWYFDARTGVFAANHSADQAQQALNRPLPEARATDPKRAKLRMDLATLRSQVELYKLQHNRCPGVLANGQFDGGLFVAQMTQPTDLGGIVRSAEKFKAPLLGPYLPRMAQNPYVNPPRSELVTGGAIAAPFDDSSGWYFQTGTNRLVANNKAAQNW